MFIKAWLNDLIVGVTIKKKAPKVKRNIVSIQNNKKIKSFKKNDKLSLTIEISKIWNFQGKIGVSIYLREIS